MWCADLEHAEAAGAAASAIRNICHSCGRYLAASYLDGLMQLYQKVQGQGTMAPAGSQKLAEQDVVAVGLLAFLQHHHFFFFIELAACALTTGLAPVLDTMLLVSAF